nr:T9SS type A sorting domain-containing protein [Bacteroidota bacterium]
SSATSGNQWYLNGGLIPGATGQSYTPVQNGSYTVVVTGGNGCTASSVPYNMSSVGIAGQQKDSEITIYPNPASEKLFIQSSEKIKTIKCVDYLGQLVDFKRTANTIDISALPQGVYFLTITNEKGNSETKKFVKQ